VSTPQAAANGKATAWDLEKAAAAAAREAGEVPFVFAYKGTTYKVPPSGKWPAEALDRLAEGELGPALAELLGQDAYAGMKKAGLNLGEINTLFEKIAAAEGMEAVPNRPAGRNSPPPRKRVSTRT
jgi:hypothetical protein